MAKDSQFAICTLVGSTCLAQLLRGAGFQFYRLPNYSLLLRQNVRFLFRNVELTVFCGKQYKTITDLEFDPACLLQLTARTINNNSI